MKYGVKVILTYSVEPDNRKFYEESIYLVDAESFEDAYKKAEEHTKYFDLEHINPKLYTLWVRKYERSVWKVVVSIGHVPMYHF